MVIREEPRILAFDTAWDYGVVGTFEGERPVRTMTALAPRVASEGLLPWIMEVVAGSGWRPGDIDAVVAGRGPGSFTGTRIAAAVAKGLADTLGARLAGVSSVEAVALSHALPGETVAVAMDARKGELLVAAYRRPERAAEGGAPLVELAPPRLVPLGEAARAIGSMAAPGGGPAALCGDAAGRFPAVRAALPPGLAVKEVDPRSLVDPAALALLGLHALSSGGAEDPLGWGPVYLRKESDWTRPGR